MARGDGVARIGQNPVAVARAAQHRRLALHQILRRRPFRQDLGISDRENQDHETAIPPATRDEAAQLCDQSSKPCYQPQPPRLAAESAAELIFATLRAALHPARLERNSSCASSLFPCWFRRPPPRRSRPGRRTASRPPAPTIMSAPSPATAPTRMRPSRPRRPRPPVRARACRRPAASPSRPRTRRGPAGPPPTQPRAPGRRAFSPASRSAPASPRAPATSASISA